MDESEIKLKKGILKFRPKARLLQLLGHELITDESIALMELVKNSYDADAKQVSVKLTNVTKKDGTIEIKDDGHGMTLETIRTAWMEPARDNKKGTDGKRSRTPRFNRLPLGEKGVGRFSSDKLGFELEIISRFCKFDRVTKKVVYLSPEEVVVNIEGRSFREDLYLDEVECQWQTREPLEFVNDTHGTVLRISDIRTTWYRGLAEKVRLALARLSSPSHKAKDFEVLFVSNDFPDLSSKIENPLLNIAPFYLKATIDEEGIMHYHKRGPDKKEPIKGKEDLRIGRDIFFSGTKAERIYRKPICGPFRFTLYAFEKGTKAKKYGMGKAELELLEDLSGVSIFRDNFRIMPYGEGGNDWLRLDRRRVQNPAGILGNDRVIGYVEISLESNPQLKDKTNREGLIEEGTAFRDLRELVIAATDYLGRFRRDFEPYEKPSQVKIEENKKNIAFASKLINESAYKVTSILAQAKKCMIENKFEEARSALDLASQEIQTNRVAVKKIEEGSNNLLEELKFSNEHIERLIFLSGIGLTAERTTHEFSRTFRNTIEILQNCLSILNLDRNHNPKINKNITLAITNLEGGKEIIKQLEPLYYYKRKEIENLNVADSIKNMEIMYSTTIEELGLDIEIAGDLDLEIIMGRGHLIQVFDNLFDNSFFWLKYKPSEDKPKILIKISSKDKTVIFADNGPGINEQIMPHLFEPFVTTKPEGRGLGLFIIREILQQYKAEIDILTEGQILKGANFRIKFVKDED